MIDLLRQKAARTGLCGIGIAPADDEVVRVFPWAKSVICAAISYLPPVHEDERDKSIPRGFVARVAQSTDYHAVLRGKLDRLARNIPGARFEVCVDTNPLPERKLAALSGMAWRGRNGCVFVEGCGSWVVLGEIVTDQDLKTDDEPLPSRCGDCTICVDSCPAQAITGYGIIDHTRCISALTQASGAIDLCLRPLMHNNIYGCDICQQVCPQNADIRPQSPEFAADMFPGQSPELIHLISMTAVEFKNISSSSIGWIRRTRIRRNAAIAAGNLRNKKALEALAQMLNDDNALLRDVARWAIDKINLDCRAGEG